MLFISLTSGQHEGKCQINGKQADFRVGDGTIRFRHAETESWEVRRIHQMTDGGDGLTHFICSDCGEFDDQPDLILAKDVALPVLSAMRRESQSTLSHLPLHKELVAEAVHQSVCEVTGTDGCRMCLYYAIAGSSLLTRLTGRLHVPQAGSLRFKVEPPYGWIEIDIQHWGDPLTSMEIGEFHVWIADVSSDDCANVTVIDLSTRHLKRLAEETESGEALTWKRPNPPEFVWAKSFKMPDWFSLQPDATATQCIWETFSATRDDWSPLLRLAGVKYELLTELDKKRQVNAFRRDKKNAACIRRHKPHR